MTLYVRNPELIAENRRRMMRRFMEDHFVERVFSFPMQMKSSKDDFTLTGLLPGITSEEVDIQFNNGTLTIEGEYRDLQDENSECLFSEFPVGKFSRSIQLDEPVVIDKIEASMKDGVLTIRIPKAEEAKPRSIKIVTK